MTKKSTPSVQSLSRHKPRSALRPLALEQRFMFDGAMVATAHAALKSAADDASAPEARPVQAVPLELSAARQAVDQRLQGFLQSEAGQAQLFALFNGGQTAPDAAWSARAAQLQQALQEGRLAVSIEWHSNAEMKGAMAAFAEQGPQGSPVIFVNADWARHADSASLQRVLLEEMGHRIDAWLNGPRDTAGDEGEAFAAAVLGQPLDSGAQQRISAENDHAVLDIAGRSYAVEEAAVTFSQVYIGTPASLSEEVSALNNIAVLSGTGFQFSSANPGDPYFSGNNVSGYLSYTDGSGSHSIYGVVSRQFKTNGVTNGFYFYASGDDGVIGTGDSNEAAYLLIVNPAKFTAGGSYGTSSDPVDTALNNYMNNYTPPAAQADVGTAVEKGGVSNASGGSNATGNVLGNDAGSATLSVTAAGRSSAGTAVSTTLAGGGTAITGLYGTLTIGSDGAYSYQVDNDNAAVQALRGSSNTLLDTFTYQVSDNHSPAGSSTTTLKITVQGANDTPTASADVGNAKVSMLTDGTAYSGTDSLGSKAIGNVLANDGDVDKYSETKSVAGLTASGTLSSYVAGGTSTSLSFTGSNGSFYKAVAVGDYLYTAKIGGSYYLLKTSSGALIQVTSKQVNADGSFSIGLSGTIDHYSSSTAFSITAGTTKVDFYPDATRDGNASLPSGKEATVNTSTAVNYSNITLTGTSGNVVVGMTASGTNIPAGAKVTAVSISGASTIVTLDVTLSSAPSGTIDFLAAGGVTVNGTYGTLVLNTDGSYTYTPLADSTGGTSGTEVFTYSMQDAGGLKSTSTLTIQVQASSSGDPNAKDDAVTGTEAGTSAAVNPVGNVITGAISSGSGTGTADAAGTGATLGANPVTAGRLGSSGTAVSISAGSYQDFVGAYGTLRLYSTGAYTYTINDSNPAVDALNTGATLNDTFYYTVTNSLGKSDTAALTLTINGANDAPVATADQFDGVEDTPLIISIADLLANDSDVDNSSLTLTGVSGAVGGSVVNNGDGTLTFTPSANFNGTASFSYTVSDGSASRSATVSILVAAVNDYPVAKGNTYSAVQDTLLTGRNVITNIDSTQGADSDLESSTASLQISRVNGSSFVANGSDAAHLAADGWMQVALSHGTLFIKQDGSTEYSPATGSTAGDSFTYTVSDGSGESDAATVQFNVASGATPTVSVNDVIVSEASPYVVFEVSLSTASGSAISFTPSLASSSAAVGTDTGSSLEYYDGTNWVSASGGVSIAAGATSVLLRTTVSNDSVFEGAESFTLSTGAITGSVANASGASGTGTIKDDGSSTNVFNAGDHSATPSTGAANNDRPTVAVNNVTVSEASPYVVFEVSLSNASGSAISFTPSLASSSATVGTDTGSSLEYYDGTNWVSASGGVSIAAGATSVLLRTTVSNDSVFEGAESFTLSTGAITGSVANASGASGTGTIKDDGSSTNVFNAGDHSATPSTGPANDDRPVPTVAVNSVTVSEASPYVVFEVTLSQASLGPVSFTPTLGGGSATVGTDTGSGLEYYDGTNWVSASGGVSIAAGATSVLLRTTVSNDSVFEGAESFTLSTGAITGSVANASGTSGTGTIKDDGSSTNVFNAGDHSATPSTGPANDDRPVPTVAVNSVTVSEASPYVVFEVTLSQASLGPVSFTPTLGGGSATVGADIGSSLEYYDGTSWVSAAGGITIPAGSTSVLVRTTVSNDASFEGAESFTLSTGAITGSVANASGANGTGTIKDDGSSTNVFNAGDHSATPSTGAANDDRPPPVVTAPAPADPVVAAPSPAPAPAPTPAPALLPASAAPAPVFAVLARSSVDAPDLVARDSTAPVIADTRTQASGFQIAVVEAPQPRLAAFQSITDQFIEGRQPTAFTLPFDTFVHSKAEAVVQLSAVQADGRALPAWARFDARAGTFQLTPPADFEGDVQIMVIARDNEGREARTMFKFHVGKPRALPGRVSFSEQLRQAAGDRLRQTARAA